jgi:hypothetical protein
MPNSSRTNASPASGPPLLISTASVPLNGRDGELPITIEQGWQAVLMWARGDSHFVPPFITSEVLYEDEAEIRKRVHYFKASVNPPPSREQTARIFPGYLAVTRYLDGTFFLALAGIDTADPADPKLFLTTVRRRRDPRLSDPAETARAKAGVPPPGTAEQNLQRILPIIRALVSDGRL